MSKPEAPDAPRHLSPESRELWRSLHARYLFEDHEEETLRLTFEALDRACAARRAQKRHGLVYLDRFDQPHARPGLLVRDVREAPALTRRRLPAPPHPPCGDAPMTLALLILAVLAVVLIAVETA